MVEIVPYKPSGFDRLLSRIAPGVAKRHAENKALLSWARSTYNRMEALSYRGGGSSRLDRDWGQQGFHESGSSASDNAPMRNRASELYAKNALAKGIVDTCVRNVIGEGIRPQARTKSKRWNANAEAAFNDWAENLADVRRLGGFYTHLQPLLFREYKINGDAGLILLKGPSGSLQVINADRIETPPEKADDLTIEDGVQLNKLGRPKRFYVRYENADGTDTFIGVGADYFVYHANIADSRDTRGTTPFQQAINANLFDQVDANIEAVVAAAQMAAMFGLVITKENSGTTTLQGLPATKDSTGAAAKALKMFPAMVKYLGLGEKIEQVKPEHPTQNWDDFIAVLCRLLGVPFGIPLELVMMDFSRTNYSSARASLLQAYRTFRCDQAAFIENVLRRIWRWRISKFIKEGVLPDRSDAWSHEWQAPGWEWVDPEKEALGYLLSIDGGWDTVSDICRRLGRDFGATIEKRKEEIAAQRAAGVEIVHSNKTRAEGAASSDGGEADE